MKRPSWLILLSLAVCGRCNEVRKSHLAWGRFRRQDRADQTLPLQLRVALTQDHVDEAAHELWKVSDPSSSQYGQYWTVDQLVRTFAPPAESSARVLRWLEASGISSGQVTWLHGRTELQVDSSVAMVEQLLSTRVFHYLNLDLGDTLVGFDNYTLPESVLGAID